MSGSGLRSSVFRTIVHQNFDDDSSANDIALLMLETLLKFSSRIMPICFPRLNSDFDGVGRVVGFDSSKVLRDIEAEVVDDNKCYAAALNIDYDSFCAAAKKEEENFCEGDSGELNSRLY